jgi:hypothetical protein
MEQSQFRMLWRRTNKIKARFLRLKKLQLSEENGTLNWRINYE